jgi:hypothetical protein
LIAFAGFDGGVEVPAEADVTATLDVRSIDFPAEHAGDTETVHIAADPALPPTHLVPLIMDFDTALVAAGPMTIELRCHFSNVAVDPQHPPTLFGVRLLPQ